MDTGTAAVIETLLADVEQSILDNNAEIAERQSANERLVTERAGLRLTLLRVKGITPQDENGRELPEVPPDDSEWQRLPRTAAIIRMLSREAKPLAPSQLAELLNAEGRNDGANAVAAALAHLHRTNRVETLGRGQWVPAARYANLDAEFASLEDKATIEEGGGLFSGSGG